MASSDATGKLVVISGPSGVGKSTICRRLVADRRVVMSVSATTRPPREGEVHGVDYYFLSRDEFEASIAAGGLIEWAEYVGELYGTPREPLEEQVNDGLVVVLDIDVQGARSVMQEYPEAITIFIDPPGDGLDVAEKRLEDRGTDSAEVRARRMERAREELKDRSLYRHQVTNDDLERAVQEIKEFLFPEEAA